MGTEQNLKEAFAGESQANRKYLAFAKKAEAEGLSQVSKLFKAAAAAETVHAHAHLRVLKGVKDTVANLKEAIEGEGFEFQEMYPKFLEEARNEENRAAEISIVNAMEVEKIHHALYSKALGSVECGKDLPDTKLYVCEVCGNTVEGDVPEKCPICGVPAARFTEII